MVRTCKVYFNTTGQAHRLQECSPLRESRRLGAIACCWSNTAGWSSPWALAAWPSPLSCSPSTSQVAWGASLGGRTQNSCLVPVQALQAGTSHTNRTQRSMCCNVLDTFWIVFRMLSCQIRTERSTGAGAHIFRSQHSCPSAAGSKPATPAVLCAGQQGIAFAIWALNLALFITFLCLLLSRAVCYPASARELLEQPNQSLFLGTLPMSISVITGGVVAVLVPRWVSAAGRQQDCAHPSGQPCVATGAPAHQHQLCFASA